MRADPDLAVLQPAAQAEPRLLDVTREQAIEVEHASHELADARQPEWLAGLALEPFDRRAVALGLNRDAFPSSAGLTSHVISGPVTIETSVEIHVPSEKEKAFFT